MWIKINNKNKMNNGQKSGRDMTARRYENLQNQTSSFQIFIMKKKNKIKRNDRNKSRENQQVKICTFLSLISIDTTLYECCLFVRYIHYRARED